MQAAEVTEGSLEDDSFVDVIGAHFFEKLKEDSELLDIAGTEFDIERVSRGELTPVFFGSALTNFGVQPFLEHFLQMTTSPLPRECADGELLDPKREEFSAFVFKIQANMNKAHRDRIAFMRICSGRFEKGMEVEHVQGKRKIKLAQPQQFMAQDREIIEEAFAGDVIGVFDPGIFSIGDTLCDPSLKVEFQRSRPSPGTLCPGDTEGYDEAQAVSQGHHTDRAGGSDPGIPGDQHRHGRDHRRRCRCPAVRCAGTALKERV